MSFLTSFRKKKTKTTRAGRPSRKDVLKKWGLRLLLAGFVVWLVCIALAADLPGRTAQWLSDRFHEAAISAGYQLKQIDVIGRVYTDPAELRKMVGLDQYDSLFRLDLDQAHGRIMTLPWVESAVLRRAWPDRLVITLIERTPMALWQHKGKIMVLDNKGTAIETPMFEGFSNLIILTGNDAPEHARGLIDMLKAEPVIFEQADSAIRVGERRWDIKLKNGLVIKLPDTDVPYALARVAQAERDFLIFSKEILSLDARFSDRMIVKASSGAADRLSDHFSSAQSQDTISVSP